MVAPAKRRMRRMKPAAKLQRYRRRVVKGRKGNARQSRKAADAIGSLKLRGSAGAVVCLPDRPELLRGALRPLRRLPLQEMVVIVLGASTPELLHAAGSHPNVRAVFRPDVRDFGVGRALGAGLAQTDTVLFVDGMKPEKAARLASFIRACDKGLDVALNDVFTSLGTFDRWSNSFRLAEFLNLAMDRRDLGAATLLTPPYAMSRRAIDALGPELLAFPVRAQVAAIHHGLRVGVGGTVPLPPVAGAQAAFPVETEHFTAAWREAFVNRDHRLSFPDSVRNRSVLAVGTGGSLQSGIV